MNWLAILIATVAGFVFGAAYYMSLSKPWLAAIGKTKEQIAAEGKGSPLPFIISIVALAVMAVVLAGTVGHLGQVNLKGGVITALFMWLGFVITTMAVNNAFGQRKASLTIIDGIHWLGVLVIQGAIIGAMGV
jgi:ABC-type sulfate transport system permease subunit